MRANDPQKNNNLFKQYEKIYTTTYKKEKGEGLLGVQPIKPQIALQPERVDPKPRKKIKYNQKQQYSIKDSDSNIHKNLIVLKSPDNENEGDGEEASENSIRSDKSQT